MFSSSADVSRGRKWRPGGVWRRARSALDRIFRRMYLVCTRMGMLFSDWEESHARNRQWWKTPDG
jgi:hypothetical protein